MMSEEELQEFIEKGVTPPDIEEGDEVSYKAVFRSLEKDCAPKLSTQFADRIIKTIEAKQKRAAKFDLIWMLGGTMAIVIACVGGLLWGGFQFAPTFLRELNDYKLIVILACVIFILIQVLDRKFVKPDIFASCK
jgi:hypothetical protein